MHRINLLATGLLAGVGLAVLAGAASAQTYATIGTTTDRQAVGATIDGVTGVAPPQVAQLRGALGVGTIAQADAGLGALTPGSYSTLTEMGRIGNDNDQRVISNHLSLLRSGDISPSGAFTEGALNVAHYPSAPDQPSARINLSTITVGGDATLGAVSFGGSVSYRDADDRLDREDSNAEMTGYSSNLFATTQFGDRMYLDAMIGAGKGDLDLQRRAVVGPLVSSLTGSTTLRTYNAGLRLGKTFDVGGAQLEPFVGARYGETRVDGFLETGGPASIAVYSQLQDSLQSDLGARLSSSFQSRGATIRPEFRATWVHEFKDDPVNFDYSLAALGPTTPRIGYTTGPLTNKDLADVGVGLSVVGMGGGVYRVDYDGRMGKDRSQNQQAFSMSARFPF